MDPGRSTKGFARSASSTRSEVESGRIRQIDAGRSPSSLARRMTPSPRNVVESSSWRSSGFRPGLFLPCRKSKRCPIRTKKSPSLRACSVSSGDGDLILHSNVPGLILLLWMSSLSMVLHLAHHGKPFETVAFAVAQAACFLAMSVEVGTIETGEPRRDSMTWFRITAALSVLGHTIISLSF